MQSIQNSFTSTSNKKRVINYDHYSRYHTSSFEPRPDTYPPSVGSSSSHGGGRRSYMPSTYDDQHTPPPLTSDPTFDILDWHPAYQSCQRFFLDHAQHEPATQALCALINIRLPFQYFNHPIESSSTSAYAFTFSRPGGSPPNRSRPTSDGPSACVSLIPYIKRLVVTGFDKAAILHGLFGDDYRRGVLPHLDCERRNYLFAAKHEGWGCKRQYDNGSGTGGDESVPFMKPLDQAKVDELTAAESAWSGWLAMEDWMVGPRAPKENTDSNGYSPRPEREDTRARMNAADNLPDGVPEAFEESARSSTNARTNNGNRGDDEAAPSRKRRAYAEPDDESRPRG